MNHHSFLIKCAMPALAAPAVRGLLGAAAGAVGPGFLANAGYGIANLLRRMGWSTPKKWLLNAGQAMPPGLRGAMGRNFGRAGVEAGYNPIRRALVDERAKRLGTMGLGAGAAGVYGGYKWLTSPSEEKPEVQG
jgi:hypothetical protein